ncbi:DUF302 domain-containing protein [Dyella flagellata]|uniref:DUF302 domain-containing protein n=1 Tax=Dyella flagellata TaxID=1867833 RepID=A0ABQ5XGS6_9GAMM|nr:DUF302 domain-containing protein [Dyella flagellata]GLQ90910.1 hypothetical protein GCM10007898_44860 [Dyella flagellata]
MNAASTAVAYAAASNPAHQKIVTSAYHFEATLERLRQAIAERDLWVIQEINPQMLLERSGYSILPARQLLFFHPRYVVRLLAIDPSAVAEIPLKMVVLQMPDGSVTVRHSDVQSLLGRYPGLTALAGELAEISQDLMRVVAQVG